MSLRHWLQLSLTDGIGPILTQRLIDVAGGAEAATAANVALLRQIDGIGAGKAGAIAKNLRDAATRVDDELARVQSAGATVICRDDPTYPTLLKEIPDPPGVLYVRGAFEPRDLHAVAIVGSRKCSIYGREQAERFAALLAGAAVCVISGGARGVDAAAHRGALAHPQGRTIAVLGSGIDVSYPPENASLFDQIAARGAVVSEYPVGTPPVAENFPRRNRIVSGMSRGVLVVEADERSGALITARQACDDHGRPVFAIPGRVDNKLSAGPHRLIRDGATLVTCLEDVLEGLGPLPAGAIEPELFDEPMAPLADAKPQAAAAEIGVSDRQRAILLHLDSESLDVDAIIERTELPAHLVLQELTLLSLKGMVKRVDGRTYSRRGARA